jgi:hypothetical protein
VSELFPDIPPEPMLADDYGQIRVLDLWECQRCKAMVKDKAGHELWHAGVDSITVALANRPR